MSEKRMTKIAGEVPFDEAGAWFGIEEGLCSLLDESCHLVEIWLSKDQEAAAVETVFDETVRRLHAGECLDFSEIEALSDASTQKAYHYGRANFLFGFQQGLRFQKKVDDEGLLPWAIKNKFV